MYASLKLSIKEILNYCPYQQCGRILFTTFLAAILIFWGSIFLILGNSSIFKDTLLTVNFWTRSFFFFLSLPCCPILTPLFISSVPNGSQGRRPQSSQHGSLEKTFGKGFNGWEVLGTLDWNKVLEFSMDFFLYSLFSLFPIQNDYWDIVALHTCIWTQCRLFMPYNYKMFGVLEHLVEKRGFDTYLNCGCCNFYFSIQCL